VWLSCGLDGLIDSSVNVGNKSVQSGIPEEAFSLECPDLELKASVLQHFILIDGKYVERLNQLEKDHCSVLRSTVNFFRLLTSHFYRFLQFRPVYIFFVCWVVFESSNFFGSIYV